MRRRFWRVLWVLAAVVGLSGCWLQPGFDANHTAFNDLETTIDAANVSGLHAVWTAQLAGTVTDPAVTGRGVYAAAIAGGGASSLTLLDQKTGSTTWSAPLLSYFGGALSSPVITGERVYVPAPTESAVSSGSVQGFDAGTGTVAPSIPVEAISITNRGNTFVGTGGICGSGGPCGTYFNVFGVDGTVNGPYFLEVGQLGTQPNVTKPVIGQQALFLGDNDTVKSFSLTPPSNLSWSTSLGGTVVDVVLSRDDGTVFAEAGSTVSALDANTGAVLWTGPLPATASAAPALAGSSLYVPLSNGQLAVFNSGGCGQATCAPQWMGTTGTSSITRQPAIVGGGVVFTASADGSLHALPAAGCGAASCTDLWSAQTGGGITGGPVVAFGQLYVGTNDGRVLAYGL